MKKPVFIPQNSDIYFQLVYPKIIEVLRLASAEPRIQNDAFSKTLFPPEEIGFLVEHTVMLANVLYKNNYILKRQLDSITELDKKFECFKEDEWTIDSMYNSIIWDESRKLASQSLQEFSVEKAIPNLYWYHLNKKQSEDGSVS